MRTVLGFLGGLLLGGLVFQNVTAEGELTSGVSHVMMGVENLQEAKDFYIKNFGMREVNQLRDKEGLQTVSYLQASRSTFVELSRVRPGNKPGFSFYALRVPDVKAMTEQLRQQGWKVEVPFVSTIGDDINYVAAPGGVRLQLVSYGKNTPVQKWMDEWK